MHIQTTPARYIRWLYELLLSVYFGLAFLMTDSGYSFVLRVGKLPRPLLRLTHGAFSSDYSFNLQYLSWLLLAGTIFIVLRILGQIQPLSAFLCQLVGSAVFLTPGFGMSWTPAASWRSWLWLEGAVAAGAALVFANRRRPATRTLLVITTLLHFGFLGFIYFREIHWWEYREWAAEAVLLPLLGSSAWGFYVWLLAKRPARVPDLP